MLCLVEQNFLQVSQHSLEGISRNVSTASIIGLKLLASVEERSGLVVECLSGDWGVAG